MPWNPLIITPALSQERLDPNYSPLLSLMPNPSPEMRQSLLQFQSSTVLQSAYPKLRALLEPQKRIVSQPQDLNVTSNPGQNSGVSANGDQDSKIQGEVLYAIANII